MYIYSQFENTMIRFGSLQIELKTRVGFVFYVHSPMKYIDDIYFFEVNTKYISSNVLKISVISRMHSKSDIADIYNT